MPKVKTCNFTALFDLPSHTGVFADPLHFRPHHDSFAGVRMVSTRAGNTPGPAVTIVGSDDGEHFYAVFGQMHVNRSKFLVDFSPKGGPANLSGLSCGKSISWKGKVAPSLPPENNEWRKIGRESTGLIQV